MSALGIALGLVVGALVGALALLGIVRQEDR
jgi:hypothetical protein